MLTILLVYVNVRLFRLTGMAGRVNMKMLFFAVVFFIMGLLLFTALPIFIKMYKGVELNSRDWIGFSTYEAPHMIVMGVAMMMCFEKFAHLPESFLRLATQLSPFVFGIYLLHTATSFRDVFYTIPSMWLMRLGWFSPMSVVLVGSCMILVCGIMGELVRKRIVIICCKRLQFLLRNIDCWIDPGLKDVMK